MSLFDETFCRDKEPPPSADDPIGFNAWSWSSGISRESSIALLCSVLSGIAGNSIEVCTPITGPVSPRLNLIYRRKDHLLSTALGSLTRPLFGVQKSLLAKSGDFGTEALYEARFGGRKRRQSEVLNQVENYRSDSSASHLGPEERLYSDAQRVSESVRFEAMAHPRILLSGVLSSRTLKQLPDCHDGVGYFCGSIENLPKGCQERNHLLDEWQTYLNGVPVSRNHTNYRTPADISEVCLRAAIGCSEDDIDILIQERPELLGHFVFVDSGEGEFEKVDQAEEERRYQISAAFLKKFYRVACQIIAKRRECLGVIGGFSEAGALREFSRLQQGFLRELARHPHATCLANAAGLPGLLVWTLSILKPQDDLDDYLLSTAFSVARQLVVTAAGPFEVSEQSGVIRDRKRLADKIVARLERLQPCTIRKLIRGFDCQRMEVFRPVIDVLLSHGIMEQSADKNVRLGRIPLSQLEVKNLLSPDE